MARPQRKPHRTEVAVIEAEDADTVAGFFQTRQRLLEEGYNLDQLRVVLSAARGVAATYGVDEQTIQPGARISGVLVV